MRLLGLQRTAATEGTLWKEAAESCLVTKSCLKQEYWSRLPFPSSGHLPDPGIEPVAPALADRFFTTEPPGKSVGLVHSF